MNSVVARIAYNKDTVGHYPLRSGTVQLLLEAGEKAFVHLGSLHSLVVDTPATDPHNKLPGIADSKKGLQMPLAMVYAALVPVVHVKVLHKDRFVQCLVLPIGHLQ